MVAKERTGKPKSERRMYSGKKKAHTRKNVVVVDERKRILIITPTKAGRRHDKAVARAPSSHAYPSTLVCDSGFQGIQHLHPNTVVTKRGRKNAPLSEEDRLNNHIIASLRIVAEHAIGGMKRFRILVDRLRMKMGLDEDRLARVCAGLWNWHILNTASSRIGQVEYGEWYCWGTGLMNDGSLALTEGVVSVSDGVKTGVFTIDMNTLSVNSTPTKPGQESTLEGHLKGERWFDVATHPTATVTIDEVRPQGGNQFTVVGTLAMKGEVHPISFPATITGDEAGVLRAEASFEIDRTLWGITSGSGSFFDNLADNVIDDMIALSFTLVAERQ